ncbi:MAG: DsbA family protein [Actinomycetota bacterium]|nr:DsbA family protein [Actinomycetota bacterium]
MQPAVTTSGGRRRFVLTWDYRGRFARNLSEHVVTGLAAGADWEVEFWPFSVEQTRRSDGQATIWEDPQGSVSFLAMQVGLVVRDRFGGRFPAVHDALFAARHDQGLDIGDEEVLRRVLARHEVDPDAVFAEVATGAAAKMYQLEHERAVAEHGAFGVPTLVADGGAAFVRILHRPAGDTELARRTVERLLDLVGQWPELNELKHTTIPTCGASHP